MQVIVSRHAQAGRPSRLAVLSAIVVGALCVATSGAVLWLVFGVGFLELFNPTTARPSAGQLVVGGLAWTLALTSPAAFGIAGVAKLAAAHDRWRARRPRITPAVRLARAVGDDHVVATNLRIPDGGKPIPELVIGPFGAAVIEELPPVGAVLSRGVRSWEVRVGSGNIRTIDNPLERAARDADRARAWLSDDDADYILKVYAAVVGADPQVTRTGSCAVLTPDQIAEWLTSLPPQRSLDDSRRERVVRLIRAAL
ncbi:MAG TPA: hypothetical protein VK831_06435 [Candidatus Deferrimicrobiaceae bacterium]|nr:hypothetical protein [Candidatus Deferrimicrobiaceae bacterium]